MTITSPEEPIRDAGTGRRTGGVLLVALAMLVAGALIVVTESGRPTDTVRAFAPVEPAPDPHTDVEQIEALVRTMLDRSVPASDRAALIVDDLPPGPSALALIDSFDGIGETTQARLEDGSVTVQRVGSDLAVIDVEVDIDLGGGGALLRSLVAQRTGGQWLLTAETLCGLARAASMAGMNLTCTRDASMHRTDGLPDIERVLSGAGSERVERGSGVPLGYWSDQAVRVDDGIWYVDYPEMSAGGGGPVGPAELHRADLRTGEVSARVPLSGTDAIVAADRTAVWALHSSFDANGMVGERLLTRVDAGTARVTGEATIGAGAYDLLAAAEGVWVSEGGLVHRYTGAGADLAGTIDLAFLPDEQRAASTDSELWVGTPNGQTRVIHANDLSLRTVTTPPGQLIGSGDAVWAVEAGPGATTARLLDRDGVAVREISMRANLDGPLWGDGDGGLWLTGWSASRSAAAARSSDEAGNMAFSGVTVDVVERPFATHLDEDGATSGTWWSASGTSYSGWFSSAGTGLGYSDGSGLTFIPLG